MAMDDLFIGFGTNGPQVAGEVESSARRIQAAMQQASGSSAKVGGPTVADEVEKSVARLETILGRTRGSMGAPMDTQALEQWSKRLQQIIANARKEIEGLAHLPDAQRVAQGRGIYGRAMGEAANLTSEMRPKFPEMARYGNLGPFVQDWIERELRQAFGTGFSKILPSDKAAASRAEVAGFTDEVRAYAETGVPSGLPRRSNVPRSPEMTSLYMQDYLYMQGMVNDLVQLSSDPEKRAKDISDVQKRLQRIFSGLDDGSPEGLADADAAGRALRKSYDPNELQKAQSRFQSSEERYQQLDELRRAQAERRAVPLGGGMWAIDPNTPQQKFVEPSRQGGMQLVTERLQTALQLLEAHTEKELEKARQLARQDWIAQRGTQIGRRDVWYTPQMGDPANGGMAAGYYTGAALPVRPATLRSAQTAQATQDDAALARFQREEEKIIRGMRERAATLATQVGGKDVYAVGGGTTPRGTTYGPAFVTARGDVAAGARVRQAFEMAAASTDKLTQQQERQLRAAEAATFGERRGSLWYMGKSGLTTQQGSWLNDQGDVVTSPTRIRKAQEAYEKKLEESTRVQQEEADAARILAEAERHAAIRLDKNTYIDSYGQAFGFTHGQTRAAPLTGLAEAEAFAKLRPGQMPGDPLSGGLLGNFLSGLFGRGFGGGAGGLPDMREGLLNLANTAGSVAKYTMLYNALFSVQNVLKDTLKEAQDYSDSLRDLTVAMGEAGPPSQAFLNNLSEISRVAGENPGAALDAAARGIRAFTDADSSSAQIDRAGLSIASASNQIALIASKDMKNATGDVVAIASAFGMAAEQANQVVDAISTAKKIGGDPANISQGLASFASIAQESGFTLQEAANAVSIVIARTDESGQAAATRLARITSILSGTTGRAIIDRINAQSGAIGMTIDPEGTVREQLQQIAQAYSAAGKGGFTELQGLIRSALGGSSNTRELNALLNNADSVFGAQTDIGAGQREFDLKSQDLVGTLKKITGDIVNLQMALVQADIFAPFAVGIKVLEPALHLLTQFLDIYNQLWDAIPGGDAAQFAVTGALEVMLAVRAVRALSGLAGEGGLGVGAAAGMVRSMLSGFRAAGQATRIAGAETAAEIRVAGSALAGSLSAIGLQMRAGSVGGTLGAVGSSVLGAYDRTKAGVSPIMGSTAMKVAGPLALLMGASEVVNDNAQMASLRAQVSDLMGQASQTGDFSQLVTDLKSNAYQVGDSGGFLGFLTQPWRGSQQAASEQLAAVFQQIATASAATDKRITATQDASVFGNLNTTSLDDLNSAMQSLTSSGATTAEVFFRLADAISGMGQAGSQVNEDKVAGEAAAAVGKGMQDYANAKYPETSGWQTAWEWLKGAVTGDAPSNTQNGAIRDMLQNPGALQRMQQSVQQELVAKHGEKLTDNDALQIAQKAAQAYLSSLGVVQADGTLIGPDGILGADTVSSIKQAAIEQVLTVLGQSGAITQEGPITKEQATMLAGALGQKYTAELGAARTPQEKISAARAQIAALDDLQARLPEGSAVGALLDAKAAAERDIVDASIEDSTKILARRRNGMSAMRWAKLAESELDRLLGEATATGDMQTVLSVMDKANLVQLRALKKKYEDALTAAGVSMTGNGLFSSTPEGQAAITAYETFMAAFNRTTAGKTGGDFSIQKDTKFDINAARRAAQVNPRDEVAVATNDLDQANRNLKRVEKESTKNSVAYWEAYKAREAAIKALADAQLAVDQAYLGVHAAKVGGDIAGAREQIKSANLALDQAVANTAQEAQALQQLWNGRRALRAALLSYRSAMAKLAGDITDPVFMAQRATQDAIDKLNSDLAHGQNKDVIAADRLAVREAQNSEERARFDQRLSDVQTNEQLGRISHAAYIRYLDSEHDRLTAIQHRTRQQQDMLNQIDLALKAAKDEMSGQWNLGDIRIPTPYEVRRSIATTASGQAYQNPGATTTIYIDGADIGMVRRVLSEQLGSTVTTSVAVSTRK